MRKATRILAAALSAVTLTTSVIFSASMGTDITGSAAKTNYDEFNNGDINQFFRDSGIDAEMSSSTIDTRSSRYESLEYFDPALKPMIDDYLYFNDVDIAKYHIISRYPKDWKIKDWVGHKLLRYLVDCGYNAPVIWKNGNDIEDKIVVCYKYDQPEIKESAEKFLTDKCYADSGATVEFVTVGSADRDPSEKITDKYEALILLREYIKNEGLKYIGAYLSDPDTEKVEVCYSSSGWTPESREEGRSEKTLDAVKEFAQKMNIDENILEYYSLDDLIAYYPVEGATEPTKMTDPYDIQTELYEFVKENKLDAVVDLLRVKQYTINTQTAAEAGNADTKDEKVYVDVRYTDPDVRKKIEAYVSEMNMDTDCIEYHNYFGDDINYDVSHIGVEVSKFVHENGIKAYLKNTSYSNKNITVNYWSEDKDVPALIENFIKERKYDKEVEFNFNALEKHSGKIKDIDEIYALLYDYCVRDEFLMSDYVMYAGESEINVILADRWFDNDTETTIRQFIKEKDIDDTFINFVYIEKRKAPTEPTTMPPVNTDLPVYDTQPDTRAPIIMKYTLKGDADLSGDVSLSDVTTVSKYLLSSKVYPFADETAKNNADINSDTVVDTRDLAMLIEHNLGRNIIADTKKDKDVLADEIDTMYHGFEDYIKEQELDAQIVCWNPNDDTKELHIKVKYFDPAVKEKLEAFAKKSGYNAEYIDYTLPDASEMGWWIEKELEKYLCKNDIKGYEQRTLNSTITVFYSDTETEVPEKVKEFIKERKYENKIVTIKYQPVTCQKGDKDTPITDADTIFIMLSQFFRENGYYNNISVNKQISNSDNKEKILVDLNLNWKEEEKIKEPLEKFINKNNIQVDKLIYSSEE